MHIPLISSARVVDIIKKVRNQLTHGTTNREYEKDAQKKFVRVYESLFSRILPNFDIPQQNRKNAEEPLARRTSMKI